MQTLEDFDKFDQASGAAAEDDSPKRDGITATLSVTNALDPDAALLTVQARICRNEAVQSALAAARAAQQTYRARVVETLVLTEGDVLARAHTDVITGSKDVLEIALAAEKLAAINEPDARNKAKAQGYALAAEALAVFAPTIQPLLIAAKDALENVSIEAEVATLAYFSGFGLPSSPTAVTARIKEAKGVLQWMRDSLSAWNTVSKPSADIFDGILNWFTV